MPTIYGDNYFDVLFPTCVSPVSMLLNFLSSLPIFISLPMPPRAFYQDSYCLLSWCGGLFFSVPGASLIPFPTRSQCPPRPQATAMEICFSHIANYLRVVTSLTVLGDNEWLIGHSSHHCFLPHSLTPSFHSSDLFDRLCWPLLSI